MVYKKKLYFLIALIGVLALLYTVSLIFNSDLINRQRAFAWLDSNAVESITRIKINSQGNEFEIFLQNNMWFISYENNVYPARQLRVQDFLNALTIRSAWQVRSSNASTHERFGLLAPEEMSFNRSQALRMTVMAGDTQLLDLLIGEDDFYRNETYFRKFDHNEVRSGDSSIKIYVNSQVSSWYNLRLVSGNDGNEIDISSVQRMTVTTPDETQIFTRRNRGWVVSGIELENPNTHAIESYIRGLLTIEGDSFNHSVSFNDPEFEYSSIELELGTGVGRSILILLTEADESGRVLAHVTKFRGDTIDESSLIYSIPSWSASRLYREAESFETN
jgi:hypothetical protein